MPSWLGWLLVALLAAVVLATWLPAIDLPLGDSHEGRILARFGLHVRNFWDDGPLASGLATDLSPYPSAGNYAHHPPLINAAHVAVSGVLGQGAAQLRLVGYTAGIATIFLGAALLRALRMRWIAILLALAAMVATPMFWIYGRLGGGFSLVLGLAAAIVALREHDDPPSWLLVAAAGLSVATVMMSWPAALTAAVLGLWLLRRRGWDLPTIMVGAAMVAGVVLSALWIFQATSLSELVGQAEARTTELGFTAGEWLGRQWRWIDALMPNWYLVLLVPGLVAGVWRRRTRFLTVVLASITVLWAVALPSGSFIHDFWNLSLLAAGLTGTAALFDWAGGRVTASMTVGAGLIGALLWAYAFGNMLSGPIYPAYFEEPAEAGRLFGSPGIPADADVWTASTIAAPRWVSWYWDAPVHRLTVDSFEDLPEDAVVIFRTDRIPEWLAQEVADRPLAISGRYVVVEASHVVEAS